MDHVPILILLVTTCFFIAGAVKGITGMGLPTVVMSTLVFVMPGSKAAALLVIPSLVTNLWQLFVGPGFGIVIRRLATMQLAGIAGTFLGIGYLTGSSSKLGNAAMGFVLIAYAVLALRSIRFRIPSRLEPLLSPLIGLLTGVLGGATGLFVVPCVPYLASLDFEEEHLVKALGATFGVSTISLAAALAWKGAFHVTDIGASSLALLPAMAGMFWGGRIRRLLRPEIFRRGFLWAVLILGLLMFARAIF